MRIFAGVPRGGALIFKRHFIMVMPVTFDTRVHIFTLSICATWPRLLTHERCYMTLNEKNETCHILVPNVLKNSEFLTVQLQ